MTDLALFSGLEYDNFHEKDHFFADTFRHYCDSCTQPGGAFVELEDFIKRLQDDRSLDPVLSFFDSLCRDEGRLRWDRLVAFHLILVAFINNIGYDEQRTSEGQMTEIASQVRNPRVLRNLVAWLPKHGLSIDHETKRLKRACSQAAARLEKLQSPSI
jgi:hypothetical protein